MRLALHAEWTKLRTLAGTTWLLLATVALTVALSAAATASVSYASAHSVEDTTKLSLTGVYLGQAIICVLAVLVIASEYSTGTITITFAAMPRRLVVLAAKATILSGLALAAGATGVLGSLLAGRLILPRNGFTDAHGYSLSLAHESTLRAAGGSTIYLVLIALLSLGIATAVRDSATAIGLVLGLLYLVPIVAQVVGNATWRRHLEQIGPMAAGLAIQNTTNTNHLPIGPWSGLAVLAAWAGAALVVGGLVLRVRDA